MHELLPSQQDLSNLMVREGMMPLEALVQHFRNAVRAGGDRLLNSQIPKISRYVGK